MKRGTLTPAEIAYLTSERRLGRLATADASGRPQVTPVGMWTYREELGVIDVAGRDLPSTRKYRNVEVNPQAALVVDDVAPGDQWHPRAVMVEGSAETMEDDGNGGGPVIRITPDRVASWGL